jgi:hypothetical protein
MELKNFEFSEEMQEMYDITMDKEEGVIRVFKPQFVTFPIAECEVEEGDVVIDLNSRFFKFTLWKDHVITHFVMFKPVFL